MSVANVLGEAHQHKGYRKQSSHSEDSGSEKTDAGLKSLKTRLLEGCANMDLTVVLIFFFLFLTSTEKFSPSDMSAAKHKKTNSLPNPSVATGKQTSSTQLIDRHTHTSIIIIRNIMY